MTQRLRNIETTLGAAFGANQTRGIEFANGFNMSAFKTTIQSVASSTAMVDDEALWLELPAGPSQLYLYAPLTVGAAAGGFRAQFRYREGAVGTLNLIGSLYGDTVPLSNDDLTALNGMVSDGASSPLAFIATGSVNLTSQGVLMFQWAQLASNVLSTSVNPGAFFVSRQITL